MPKLGQNVFARLPARLGNSGGPPSKRVGADNPGLWLPADTKSGPKNLNPKEVGGGVGVRLTVKMVIFFAGHNWPTVLRRLSQPATHRQGG